MRFPYIIALGLTTALAAPAFAVELSLEENRAQRGNIAFIDMHRLFKAYPETLRAKENFEEIVRQAEEQVNVRRADILRLRADIVQLKTERDFIAKNPSMAFQETPAPAPDPVTVTPSAPDVSTAPVATDAAALMDAALSTHTAMPPLPGLSTGTAVAKAPPPPAAPAPKPKPESAPAPKPGRAAELDETLEGKRRELAQKEADFKEYQASAEKNLLDLESRRSEILLGKLHKAVKEVARREGISVVVDKSAILFGHEAVDITDKVLKYLRGS